MDRIPRIESAKNGSWITRPALLRSGLLAVTLTVITIDSSLLLGQRSSAEDAAAPATLPAYQMRPLKPNKGSFPSKTSAVPNNNAPGRVNLDQAAAGNPHNSTSKPTVMPGTDPKKTALWGKGNAKSSPASPTAVLQNTMPAAGPMNSAINPANSAINPAMNPANPTTNPANSGISQAAYLDTDRGLNYNGDPNISRAQSKAITQKAQSLIVNPGTSSFPPPIHGSIIGSHQESNIEIIVRLKGTVADLEQVNEGIRRENAELQTHVKGLQDQLFAVIREIQSARKEVALAKNDQERLRVELQNLRDKIRLNQKEHADVLQSMGPLLQQLLESDDVGAVSQNPME